MPERHATPFTLRRIDYTEMPLYICRYAIDYFSFAAAIISITG